MRIEAKRFVSASSLNELKQKVRSDTLFKGFNYLSFDFEPFHLMRLAKTYIYIIYIYI